MSRVRISSLALLKPLIIVRGFLLPLSQTDSSNSQLYAKGGYAFGGYNPRIRSITTFAKYGFILYFTKPLRKKIKILEPYTNLYVIMHRN